MKSKLLTILFMAACLMVSAQDAIQVHYQGAKPTITDFGWSFLDNIVDDDEEDFVDESARAIKFAWMKQRNNESLDEGETLTIDVKNGYVYYESNDGEQSLRIEMCYWNESDGKHKVFAYNVKGFTDGIYNPGQFDGLAFYRYDNASETMTPCYDMGFDLGFGTDDGGWVSYTLPHTGKDITVTKWHGKNTDLSTLKWNGKTFDEAK